MIWGSAWCGNEKVQVKCSSLQLSRTAHDGCVCMCVLGGPSVGGESLTFSSQWTHSACHSAPISHPSPVLAEAAQALYLAPHMVFPLITFSTRCPMFR